MFKAEVLIISSVMLAFSILFIGLIRGINEISSYGELAMIEQLREDVGRVGFGANEDVIGQVAQWNQEIKAKKRYRMLWLGRICVSEEWESVDVIEIP